MNCELDARLGLGIWIVVINKHISVDFFFL